MLPLQAHHYTDRANMWINLPLGFMEKHWKFQCDEVIYILAVCNWANFLCNNVTVGKRRKVVGRCTMLRVRRLWIRFSMRPLDSFNLPNHSSCNMGLWLTQPLTEMSTRNISHTKAWGMRKANNLINIFEAAV
jgi:hypothetical protein